MEPTPSAVADLFAALARHARLIARGDMDDSRRTGIEIGGHVAHVAGLAGRPMRTQADGPPPRAVALAMAKALYSVPHMSRTLSVYSTRHDAPLFDVTPSMSDALGLTAAELEEIRTDIDLRVSGVLKQTRALHWLWQRAGNPRLQPEALFHMLFPGAVGAPAQRFTHRGCRLYALIDEEVPPPREALYLPWLPESGRWSCVPDTHFAARFVDPATIRGVCRGIGASEEEVRDLLDQMVCTVPSAEHNTFLDHDRWRGEGWAALTGLGRAHPSAAWVSLPLASDGLPPDGWIAQGEGGLALSDARRVFDRHAMSRVTIMMQGLYAELCARVLLGETIAPDRQAALFDLAPYVQRCLQPLLDWAAAPATHREIADQIGADVRHVGAALATVREGWLKAARASWGGVPTEERPYTVQSILVTHLAITQASLFRAWRMEADNRAPHHRVLLLFFAHYAAAAPVGRLWRPENGRLPPPEDVIAEWFWGTWQRVLAARDADGG